MSRSFSFDNVDMGTYGLVVERTDIQGVVQMSQRQLIQYRSYTFKPKFPPKNISLGVAIAADDRSTLVGYLDSIKKAVLSDTPYALALDNLTGRYWLAKLESMNGSYGAPNFWRGVITFVADDPMAFDNTEVGDGNDYAIDAAEKTISEVTEGTGYINPVYNLTAKENLGAITIKLKNLTTDEELQWTGALTTDDELEIYVADWIVKKNAATDMSTVTGQFPRLAPDTTNSIKVTALYSSVAGNLNIKYRNRYL